MDHWFLTKKCILEKSMGGSKLMGIEFGGLTLFPVSSLREWNGPLESFILMAAKW
jgi:hypothetical protein